MLHSSAGAGKAVKKRHENGELEELGLFFGGGAGLASPRASSLSWAHSTVILRCLFFSNFSRSCKKLSTL